ncbi:YraN family protein [uncultured Microbacterium sp.]|uniref:YraN family protein n=1 Tax=uncultured Microbacterium sp. TaxID=191216 RepID=UPI0025E7954A|nr:YraN family protein [uncultured Microbacterium sp.]
MAAKDDLGRAGEERASEHLRQRGWVILDRNWRCRHGEIDIVALDGDAIVAIEVKTRSGRGFGHPFEAVTALKLRRLHELARLWAKEHPDRARGRALRVDAVAIIGREPQSASIEHLEGLS